MHVGSVDSASSHDQVTHCPWQSMGTYSAIPSLLRDQQKSSLVFLPMKYFSFFSQLFTIIPYLNCQLVTWRPPPFADLAPS